MSLDIRWGNCLERSCWIVKFGCRFAAVDWRWMTRIARKMLLPMLVLLLLLLLLLVAIFSALNWNLQSNAIWFVVCFSENRRENGAYGVNCSTHGEKTQRSLIDSRIKRGKLRTLKYPNSPSTVPAALGINIEKRGKWKLLKSSSLFSKRRESTALHELNSMQKPPKTKRNQNKTKKRHQNKSTHSHAQNYEKARGATGRSCSFVFVSTELLRDPFDRKDRWTPPAETITEMDDEFLYIGYCCCCRNWREKQRGNRERAR